MKYLLLIAFFSLTLCAEVFKVYTEQSPPYSFLENGNVKGSSTRLVEELFAKSGHQFFDNSIRLLPWARGYRNVLNETNSMIYSMVRSPEREALFQWVGPVGKMTLGIIAKKSRHLQVPSPSVLHRYKIATIPDTASEKALLDLDFRLENLERFANRTSQLKKLQENRVDAIAFSVESAFSLLEEMGCDISEYEVVYVLKESDLYFAFNKETNPKMIDNLNNTLKTLVK
ncbi:substrate-binding periplasmic protein [Sulfurospirillum arsenophilum]|uniref:substrate-binding periplasmic protein n=1 Tax=Sulfurospirillum arsenophilum TaxID=56698 RepID=UPI0005A5D15F|nr:transporter substrate-binding domain-containing protein [Sulfurospirillum arsenophilum]